jgi:hypothetical protein
MLKLKNALPLELGVLPPIKTLIDALPEKLNLKLNYSQTTLDKSNKTSDQNLLDTVRSRAVEQEVLDLLDEP